MNTTAAELFERHAVTVFRYFHRMTASPDLAEDLTQEVFVRVVRGLHRYEARDREIGWLLSIARHVLADRRMLKRVEVVPIADVEEPAQETTHIEALAYNDGPILIHAECVKTDNVFPMIPAGAPLEAMMTEPPKTKMEKPVGST